MKHPPKPDGTRYETADGHVTLGMKDYTPGLTVTDGENIWAKATGEHIGTIHTTGPKAGLNLVRPVTVAELPAPPEEPKPPKEVWLNVYHRPNPEFPTRLGHACLSEAIADELFEGTDPRLTGHAIRYVLPDEAEEWKNQAHILRDRVQKLEILLGERAHADEAERGFSEEEIEAGLVAYSTVPLGASAYTTFKTALSAISQHRSKKP